MITIVDIDVANEEYSVVIPKEAKSYTVKMRGNHEFKLAYKTGQVTESTGNFITIPSGSAESEDELGNENDITLYVACEKGNEKFEVKIWR